MRKRFRTRQADLLMLVSGIPMKFACQAALLPSVLLAVVAIRPWQVIEEFFEYLS
jgi:hypothetical protein